MSINDVDTDTLLAGYLREDAPVFYLALDETGIVLDSSRYAEETIGRSLQGEPIGKILGDFFKFSPKDLCDDDADPTLVNVTDAGGNIRTVYFRFVRHRDRIIAMGKRNIHETDNLEDQLMELNAQFSSMSRELQKKTVELEKLNELKNEFIGTAAHDLRNPIGAIRNLSNVLLTESSGSLRSEQAEILRMIETSSNFILALLDDLLSIARIEAGKLNLNLQEQDITTFIQDNIKINRIFALNKNVTIRYSRYEKLPPVPFDRLKIEQVMNNLVSNAIKYSPSGGEVVISSFRTGNAVTVTVSDEGPGIPDKDRARLFKPFSRTSVRTPDGEQSTGLGLAIAKNIVVGHLGEIGLQSNGGPGATFYFTLPLERPFPA